MAGKRQVRTLLDLTTPEGDGEFEFPAPGNFEYRWPKLQPLHQGGGALTNIGPAEYYMPPNTGWEALQPPAGMSLENQGLSYTLPFRGGQLEAQYLRPPLTAKGGPEYGLMFNWKKEF